MDKRLGLLGVVGAVALASLASTPSPAGATAGRYVVGGVVYNDANGNSTRDPDEKGVEGVPVTLTLGSDTKTQNTSAQGTFVFTRLAAGKYTVELGQVPDGLSSAANTKVDVEIGTGKELGSVSFPLVSGAAATSSAEGSTSAASEATTASAAEQTSAATNEATTTEATTPTSEATTATSEAAAESSATGDSGGTDTPTTTGDASMPETGLDAGQKAGLGGAVVAAGLLAIEAVRRRSTVH